MTSTLTNYALKTDIPTLPTDHVTTSELNKYSTTTVCDDKYIAKNGNATLNGNLTVNVDSHIVAGFVNTTGGTCHIRFGNEIYGNNCGIIQFGGTENPIVALGMYGADNIICYNQSNINLYKPTIISGNLTVTRNITGTLANYYSKTDSDNKYALKTEISTSANLSNYASKTELTTLQVNLDRDIATVESNCYNKIAAAKNDLTNLIYSFHSMTITHYAPIEAGQNISAFSVGKPVFMSGHVYKHANNDKSVEQSWQSQWQSATANDSTDCICSVVNNGTYKEFVGVITDIDENNHSITFATHGDFLFYVDDANLYQIGDVVLFDGRILDDEYVLTLKIQQSIVGKVSAKINEHTLAIFRD